ncbi:MAG: hypothetical protein LBC51_04685 [Treponema sp.]|jgi:hypothetical protein|nr:hypothetical protein [Treponema sp.]
MVNKKIIFFSALFLIMGTMCLFAQEITIYLDSATEGRVVSSVANVNTKAWFRSTTDLRGTAWLVDGYYDGEVGTFTSGTEVVRISGGPNNISRGRGISIHGGSAPEHSDGCVVIAKSERDKLYSIFQYGNRTITIRVVDNR